LLERTKRRYGTTSERMVGVACMQQEQGQHRLRGLHKKAPEAVKRNSRPSEAIQGPHLRVLRKGGTLLEGLSRTCGERGEVAPW
jgi:hypothetical protein